MGTKTVCELSVPRRQNEFIKALKKGLYRDTWEFETCEMSAFEIYSGIAIDVDFTKLQGDWDRDEVQIKRCSDSRVDRVSKSDMDGMREPSALLLME